MKAVFTILIFAALVFGQAKTNTIYDTITVKQTVIDTIHKAHIIPDSLVLHNAQKFYQDSFNNLLFFISILITIFSILLGVIQYFVSYLNAKKIKEDSGKIQETQSEKFQEMQKNYEKLESENIKTKTEIKEISEEVKKRKAKIDISFMDIGKVYLTLAKTYLENKDLEEYFFCLSNYLNFYITNDIKIEDTEREYLIGLAPRLLDKYESFSSDESKYISRFLHFLDKLGKYCKENKCNENNSDLVNNILKELYDIIAEMKKNKGDKASNHNPKGE